ncbi:MAG TPA: hypothetical protein VHL57_12495 [Flavobacteriales bacterium]|jgi:hypothetical protein|nr:hypothetical protein [Flavobacteriales bacterium]
MKRPILSLVLAVGTARLFACSCFGPTTFCGTLDPPYDNPEWWVPHAIVLGVKQTTVAHGFDTKILEVYTGGDMVHEEQVVRVWGDCGFACRVYPDTWNDGDTVVFGLRICDQQGNFVCGTQLESETDFMISICGIYYLSYANGVVSGPILTENGESMPLGEFRDVMDNCLSTGITPHAAAATLQIGRHERGAWVALPEVGSAQLLLFDAMGRQCLNTGWDGTRRTLEGFAAGTYIVQVRQGERRWVGRVVLDP